jgi:hypothetical protein
MIWETLKKKKRLACEWPHAYAEICDLQTLGNS